MKRINTKKRIYVSPLIHIITVPVNDYMLSGSEIHGVVLQLDNSYSESAPSTNPIVDDSGDVLSKPFHSMWEEE